MITEITKSTDETGGGWVLYDAECRFCVGLARRAARALARREFRLVPLQTDGARAGLGENRDELLREMRVVTAQGRVFGGAAAVVELARHFWWAAWLQVVAKLPLGKRALDAGYRWIAARRYCLGGACELAHGVPASAGSATECISAGPALTRNRPASASHRSADSFVRETVLFSQGSRGHGCPRSDGASTIRWWDALLLVGLPVAAALAAWNAPAWVLMWSVAFALFAGLKWLSWHDWVRGSSLANRLTPRPGPLPVEGRGRSVAALVECGARSSTGVATESQGVPNAAADVPLEEGARRAPSPLNGERAGVRGENANACTSSASHPVARSASGLWRNIAFLALWPGMDARRFLAPAIRAEPPTFREWVAAGLKTILGVVLVWGMARVVLGVSPLLAGWAGMIGVALFLHFGLFHLVSLMWRAAGVDAPAIMRTPLLATSLADFWGKRWNLAFSVPARRFVLKPLASRLGRGIALMIVFLVSGLMHELVISVPARAAYGLPTAYFLAQGAAILFERSDAGRRLGLGAGWRGWAFAVLCTAGPAFWLFSPTFVHRVILPFLQAIGAT